MSPITSTHHPHLLCIIMVLRTRFLFLCRLLQKKKKLHASPLEQNVASVFWYAFISVLSQPSLRHSWGWHARHCICTYTHNGLLSLPLSAAGAVETHGRGKCISISKKAVNVCESMHVCECVCVPRCSLNQNIVPVSVFFFVMLQVIIQRLKRRRGAGRNQARLCVIV